MQHGVDSNGYLPSSPGGEIGDQSTESKASRQRRGSSPGKRALNWFRSRSASPASVNHVEDGPSSPSSFVVRKVTKQPGGVSHITDVHGSPVDEHVHQPGYPYQQVKSRPLSLGVPPGGPGGGTGYGTAKSTNDGRPEREREQQPFERGRSRSKSPNRPPSPGAITAGAFRGGRIAPGPLSYRQAAEQHEDMLAKKQNNQDRKLSNPPSLRDSSAPTPSGPRISPFPTGSGQFSTSPHQTSPLAGSAAAPALTNISAQANESPSRFSMPVHIPHGSGLPPVIPLEGIPSPVKIPYSSPNRMGASPLGSASPAGSPGYFGGTSHEDRNSSQPGSPHFASKWFKGIFGKSPRLEERDDGIYNNEGSWMRQSISANGTSPNHAMMQQNPNAWSDGLPLAGSGTRDQRDARRDSVEAEALARKKHSMMMAARIEDEHRNRLISGEQRSFDASKSSTKQWLPQQVIGDAPLSQEPEQWDPPQSKSPPGRKPAPRFTAQDLEAMSQKEREQVATEVDPEDRLSRLEGKLTPAQQIIAETRSKMSSYDEEFAKGQLSQSAKDKHPINTLVQRGFDTNRRSSNGGGDRPPTLPTKSPHGSEVKQSTPKVNNTEQKEENPTQTAPTKATPRTLSNAGPSGLTAGTGPMPKDMPMNHALQEMMVRFYRFERYAVPLMRSLEGRLIDIERDNQMALNGDGMSANSARDREMDRWVGQMTKLMRHEVGQLQAATHELRGSRELLAAVAKNQGVGTTSSGFLSSHSPIPTNTTNTLQKDERAETSKAKEMSEPAKVPSEMSRNLSSDARRGTNTSSTSFKSAIRKPEGVPVTSAANTSPNGRKRYTHALGRPMHDGKISPLVSPRKEIDQPILETPASPSPSDISTASRRAVSIDERLKALMVDKSRSPSLTTQDANSSLKSGMSLHGIANQFGSRDEDASDDTSFEKVPLPKRNTSVKIGDDYQLVMARGDSEASATSASGQSSEDVMVKTIDDDEDDDSIVPDLSTKRSQHLQTPSNFSTQTDTTIKPSIAQQQQQQQSVKRQSSLSVNSRAISTPTSPGRLPLSPNLTGNSLRLATPTRQGSTSPISMVPNETTSNIKTANHASNGLRARAQSYLQNAEQPSSSSGSALSSANVSASNSSSWNRISNSSSPQPPSSPSKVQPLKSSSSSNVLRDRNLNGSGDINSKVQFPSSTSEEAVSVLPLKFKKSAHSIKSTSQRSDRADSSEEKSAGPLAPGNFDTIKGNTIKSSFSTAANSTVSTPSRPSIKDRVAFFDSAQKV